MPKNAKSKKNGSVRNPVESIKGELLLKIDGSVYGQTTHILGDCNFTVMCFDGSERMCHLRKGVKKGEKVCVDTVVLIGLRDYQDNKGDIIYVYSKEQVNQLRQLKEIPTRISSGQDTEENKENADETGFDFDTI
jgi:translation initiation factor 1A